MVETIIQPSWPWVPQSIELDEVNELLIVGIGIKRLLLPKGKADSQSCLEKEETYFVTKGPKISISTRLV